MENKPTLHCYQCGRILDLPGQPGRGERCIGCGSDLRVCRNCVSWDPCLAYQCRDRRAEEVTDKTNGNFCEYFEFAKRVYTPTESGSSKETQAKANLKKLLGL